MPDVFEALCAEASWKVQDFNAQGLANTLWAMAKSGTRKPEVLEAFRRRAAQLSASRCLSASVGWCCTSAVWQVQGRYAFRSKSFSNSFRSATGVLQLSELGIFITALKIHDNDRKSQGHFTFVIVRWP